MSMTFKPPDARLVILVVTAATIASVKPALICRFGAANIPDLASRNWSYINRTNAFLENYALKATNTILNVSTFNLTDYLVNKLKWDLKRQSYSVGRGILHQTDWATVTTGFQSKVDLPSYIQSVYLNPVHTKMQYFADWYVVSRGIYRPMSLDFFFSGLGTNLSDSKIVPRSCYAGCRVVLQIATNMTYEASLVYPNSTEFAVFTSMLELAFDQFFRGAQSIFTGDFIRVNVLTVYKINFFPYVNRLAAEVEFYFENVYNASFIIDCIVGNITLLPPMAFILNQPVPVTVLTPYVRAIQTDIAPTIPTTSTFKTESTVPANLTSNNTQSTAVYSNVTANFPLNVTTISPAITTFDSDPLFLAVAPVLPKKYNDPVMVPRPVSVLHLTAQVKECILTITLPTAIGIIGIVVGLLICLQSDWLPNGK